MKMPSPIAEKSVSDDHPPRHQIFHDFSLSIIGALKKIRLCQNPHRVAGEAPW